MICSLWGIGRVKILNVYQGKLLVIAVIIHVGHSEITVFVFQRLGKVLPWFKSSACLIQSHWHYVNTKNTAACLSIAADRCIICKDMYKAVEHFGDFSVVGLIYEQYREIIGNWRTCFLIEGCKLPLILLEDIIVLIGSIYVTHTLTDIGYDSLNRRFVSTVACKELRTVGSLVNNILGIYRYIGICSHVVNIAVAADSWSLFICSRLIKAAAVIVSVDTERWSSIYVVFFAYYISGNSALTFSCADANHFHLGIVLHIAAYLTCSCFFIFIIFKLNIIQWNVIAI